MVASNFSNVTTFTGFLAEANVQTSGWFWSGINIMIFLVLFITIASSPAGWEAGLFSAGFVTIILSVFLTYLGLQSMWITGVMIGLILLLFIYISWSNRYD